MWYGFNVLWFFSAGGPNPEISPEKIIIDENDLDFMAEMGCNFVRVPTDYRYFVPAVLRDQHERQVRRRQERRAYVRLRDRNPRDLDAAVRQGRHRRAPVQVCDQGRREDRHQGQGREPRRLGHHPEAPCHDRVGIRGQ